MCGTTQPLREGYLSNPNPLPREQRQPPLALGYPQLWTRIDLFLDPPAEFTSLWFKCSQPCLVDVTLNVLSSHNHGFYHHGIYGVKARAFREILQDNANRIGRLTLIGTSAIVLREAMHASHHG